MCRATYWGRGPHPSLSWSLIDSCGELRLYDLLCKTINRKIGKVKLKPSRKSEFVFIWNLLNDTAISISHPYVDKYLTVAIIQEIYMNHATLSGGMFLSSKVKRAENINVFNYQRRWSWAEYGICIFGSWQVLVWVITSEVFRKQTLVPSLFKLWRRQTTSI